MKRLLVFVYTTLLFAPVLDAQESTPARPPMEQQGPRGPQAPGPGRSSPPAQEAIPVPVPIAPPKPNGPVQKSLVRITATSVEPDYKAPWNAGGLERGVGAGFVNEHKLGGVKAPQAGFQSSRAPIPLGGM